MGLDINVVETIFREHLFRSIDGDILLIGRQAVYFSPQEILDLMIQNGLEPQLQRDQIELDKTTINRDAAMENQRKLVSDKSVFQLLGNNSVHALDHSDYEGAEVIHDLTKPLPDKLKAITDFIVDGSTLDNTFSPARTIQNYAELLRPGGGRIVMGNMLSNHHQPYNMMPPLWYLDYFTINKFVDCKVYIVVTSGDASNAFCLNLDWLMDPSLHLPAFDSPYQMGVVVFAEKGPDSTSDVFPAQQHYRSEEEWKTYRKNLATIKSNPRPHLMRSHSPLFFLGVSEEHPFVDIRGGHFVMDDKFQAVDPTSEAIRQKALLSTQKIKKAS